jgi:hypothetical protein
MRRFLSSSGVQADFPACVAVEPPGEVKLEQRHLHRAAGCARQADDLIDRHWRWAEQRMISWR